MTLKVVEPAIYELLKNLAGGAVYALRAPQGSKDPFVIFQRINSERWRSINNPSGIAQAHIQIDAYAGSYYEAKTLAASVEEILDGYKGTVSSVRIAGISLQDDHDTFDQTDEPFLFRVSATYFVTYQQ